MRSTSGRGRASSAPPKQMRNAGNDAAWISTMPFDSSCDGTAPASWNGLGERSASEPESKPLSPLNDAPEALEHDAVATTAPPTRALSER